jgi:hypothetical protein
MYKLVNDTQLNVISCIIRDNNNGSITSFGKNPDNTDYQAFKQDLANGVALSDAEGTAMTAEQIKTFLETLP